MAGDSAGRPEPGRAADRAVGAGAGTGAARIITRGDP